VARHLQKHRVNRANAQTKKTLNEKTNELEQNKIKNQSTLLQTTLSQVNIPVCRRSIRRRALMPSSMRGLVSRQGQTTSLNLANLAAYTVDPGVAQIPSDSWLAEPI
jgi:hypothetical protein